MIRLALLAALMAAPAVAEPVLLHAAGSLRAALAQVAADFTAAEGVAVATAFAASGTLRARIEGGEAAQVFASANMAHPQRLADAGKAGPVALFARKSLCALVAPGVAATPDTLLDALLSDAVRVAISTPKAARLGAGLCACAAGADRLAARALRRGNALHP